MREYPFVKEAIHFTLINKNQSLLKTSNVIFEQKFDKILKGTIVFGGCSSMQKHAANFPCICLTCKVHILTLQKPTGK